MDVAAAFPSVARGCLLRKMRNMGLNENLVRWTNSFMRDRKVFMNVGGQDGEPLEVTRGLPQGSPISPDLFAIYIADIRQAVEGQVADSRGISFVDCVTWLAEGASIDEVVQRLEQCAKASLEWASNNAVLFETSKTEAILFSRNWQDTPGRGKTPKNTHQVRSPRCSGKESPNGDRLGTMLYASEPTWNDRKGVEGEYQAAINRMGRISLGAFRAMPLGIAAAEANSRRPRLFPTTARPDALSDSCPAPEISRGPGR